MPVRTVHGRWRQAYAREARPIRSIDRINSAGRLRQCRPILILSVKEQQCRPFLILSVKGQQCGGSNRARDAPSSRLPPHGTPACLPPSERYAASSCEGAATATPNGAAARVRCKGWGWHRCSAGGREPGRRRPGWKDGRRGSG
jgi:hypothetical protein